LIWPFDLDIIFVYTCYKKTVFTFLLTKKKIDFNYSQ